MRFSSDDFGIEWNWQREKNDEKERKDEWKTIHENHNSEMGYILISQ